MKKLCIRQREFTDCGAACLASVSAFYGQILPVSKFRQIASMERV